MPEQQLSLPEALARLEDLAGSVIEQVSGRAQVARDTTERLVLSGLQESAETRDRIDQMLETGRVQRQEVEAVAEMLAQAEQKLAFFQGCTMRRSSWLRDDTDADACAAEGEHLATSARAGASLERLIQAYKRTEALEGEILQLREERKSGTGPEPRILDLPRARVLAARRTVGAAIVALDQDD